jgi:hypothetical protein
MPMNEEINRVPFTEGTAGAEFEPLLPPDQVEPKRSFIDFEKFKAQTGAGDLSEYKNHPLNWNQSKPVARIIRGFTGLLGELNFAVVDILIGFFEMTSKKKGLSENGTDLRGNGGIS